MWDSNVEKWEEGFDRLVQYVNENGHARVPVRYTVGEHKLGIWAAVQRRNYARGTLAPDRVQRLDALKGWEWVLPRGPQPQ